MPCYCPQPAVRLAGGTVKFVSRDHPKAEECIVLPCGQCIGCRLERSRQWAVRCYHESKCHELNSFITLTYDDANIPAGGSLHYPDFQKFLKRLRKFVGVPISFYMGGEYGELLSRPHYHVIIFGYDFPDKKYYRKTVAGSRIYTSDLLAKLWPFGLSSIGDVTFESAAYIARYCVQKVNGQKAKSHYETISDDGEILDRVPEFNHMSLKPAIGKRFLEKFHSDVYPRDYVVVRGSRQKPPKYYDKLLAKSDPDLLESLKYSREIEMEALQAENPDEFVRSYFASITGLYDHDRLFVKGLVSQAGTTQFRRNLS